MESFRSSTSSDAPSFFSFRSDDSFYIGYRPPVSEQEEIPSFRWLSALSSPSQPTLVPAPSGGDGIKPIRPAAGYASIFLAAGAGSVFGARRGNRDVPVEVAHKREPRELELFQTHVANRLLSLTTDGGEGKLQERRHPLISLSFLRQLLDAFVCIEEEFKELLLVLLDRDPALVRWPLVARLVSELLDRAVGTLDVCSAVGRVLDWLHFCQRYGEIAASALRPAAGAAAPSVREAQLHRARKALSNLLASLGPDRCSHRGAIKERTWLSGRSSSGGGGAATNGDGGGGDLAAPTYGSWCLPLSLSRNWSAAKQMQAMWANFTPPHGADATAVAKAVYTMTTVMVFVVRTLVVAFPCEEEGGQGSSAVTNAPARSLVPPWLVPWAAPMVALQERIAEESRRDTKVSPCSAPSPGLLAELQSLARCGRVVVDLGGGSTVFPLEDRQREDVADVGRELAVTCRAMEEHLGPLRRQVREVFHRVLLSRGEILSSFSHDEEDPFPAEKP